MGVAACMPPAWLAPWSSDVAAIAAVPIRPLEWTLARVRRALRPAATAPGDIDERLRELTEDRDHYRALWFAERLRVGEVEARLEAVEAVRRLDRSGARPISASILAHVAGPGSELLAVDVGRDAGVSAGDPVVVKGDRLLGRIADQPQSHRALIVPTTHRLNGRIDALIDPGSGGDPSGGDAAFVPVQLSPQGGDRLVGEIAAGGRVAVGDIVRLADPAWKRAAQGMRLGVVRSMRPLDSNPLRLRIEVIPEVEVSRVGVVVVKGDAEP
ncbi:MAG: hypothetical protein KF724_05905 [Phycisphaeraceae bacterium]|nr:hypothetical protein [Phycisphaeraceae bacterium]